MVEINALERLTELLETRHSLKILVGYGYKLQDMLNEVNNEIDEFNKMFNIKRG